MELEPTGQGGIKQGTTMKTTELMSYVYQIPQQLPARATAGSSTLVPPGEEHTMALLQSIMWGPGNAARAGGAQRQPQDPPALGNTIATLAGASAAPSVAALPAGVHGGALGRVLDLERVQPDHRTGPFGSHTVSPLDLGPGASAGMVAVTLGAAAPEAARSAAPGPGPEGQHNPWPLQIQALNTYHTASAALQSLGGRQQQPLGITGLQQQQQLNQQQQQPQAQVGAFSFAPRGSHSTSLSAAPSSSLHDSSDGQRMAAQNLLQLLQQQQLMQQQQQQHGRLPLAVDASTHGLQNSSSGGPDVPMHDTSALQDALVEARALLEQRARGPAGGGSGGVGPGLGPLDSAGRELDLLLLQQQQEQRRRESQTVLVDGSGVARVSGGDGGGGGVLGAVARYASLGSTIDNAAATRAGAPLPALLQHYAGSAAQAAAGDGGGGGGKTAATSNPHDPDDDEDEEEGGANEEDEEWEDTDTGSPRRRTRKRGVQAGGARKRGGGGGGGGSGSSSRGRNQDESQKNVSRERNRTAQRRFRERQREMLRTLKEQVQQRDAVIADLRRQLALVTSAAAAHGVQLQQLPGRGGAG